jgi:L,D-peptidoglycan transpeptidase YkuD (ErfK/YbiS/YcfS/YnhG family)
VPSVLRRRALLTAVAATAVVALTLTVLARPASEPSLRAGPASRTAQLTSATSSSAVALVRTPDGDGYWVASSTGGVFAFGDAASEGSMGGQSLNAPMVGMAATPDGQGYWLVASDGGIFSFGDATFEGSMGGHRLNAPIVAMAAAPQGGGYWLVASDGGIFAFGSAKFYGSMGGQPLNQPIVGLAPTPNGQGYWEVAADGGIFSFGSATFKGSMGGRPLNAPIVGLAATPSGQGYWEVASDGGIFSFGNAAFEGSMGGKPLNAPISGLAATPSGQGYWEVARDGGIFNFGNAAFEGSATADINPLLVDQLASTDGAQQVIVVDAPSAASTTATLYTFENDGSGWHQVFAPMPAVNGLDGWLPGPQRVEGDGTTPEGIFGIGATMYGVDANPGTKFPYHQLVCGDWWDEDPSSSTYNTFEHVACGSTPPFAGDSEALWTEGDAYPSMAVINFNTPPTGDQGSGIFLHADIGSPTNGCVSLPYSDLVSVLDWLNPALHPVIVMGPASVIRSY